MIVENCGTPAYMSPESFGEEGYYGFTSDIWSLGVLLHAMVSGRLPFSAPNVFDLQKEIKKGMIQIP